MVLNALYTRYINNQFLINALKSEQWVNLESRANTDPILCLHLIKTNKIGNYPDVIKSIEKAADQGLAAAQYNLGLMYDGGRGVQQNDTKACEWYQKAADQGFAAAQYNLGLMYDGGHGVQQDETKACEWYQKAADQGFAAAQYNLGFMYDGGHGVQQDETKACEWYQKAADQGFAAAQFQMGYMFEQGRGVQQDDTKAIEWYQKAADQGLSEAQYKMGYMYRQGHGVQQDETKACEWYQKAADQGFAAAQFKMGDMYRQGRGVQQDETKACEWYQKAADQGFAAAQYNLGLMYDGGRGVQQDETKACEWYQKAADQGLVAAQYNLGDMYRQGRGVQQDETKACEWYQKAADQGLAAAQFQMGYMFEQGRGVQQDDTKAIEWYQKAADQGLSEAQYNLGDMYRQGRGVQQNDTKAIEWYQKAADQGLSAAQFKMGYMFEQGRGVQQNDTKAIEWYQKAADQGLTTAQYNLGDMYRQGRGVQQDETKACEWYQKAADQGLAAAQFKMGYMFEQGRGVQQNDTKAIEWYQKAADQGLTTAQFNLGDMYRQGRGVQQDETKACEWYQKAADQGLAAAQFQMGYMFEQGRGVQQNDTKAIEWYQKAADTNKRKHPPLFNMIILKLKAVANNGNIGAQLALGKIFSEDIAIEKDEPVAVQWYQKALNENFSITYPELRKMAAAENTTAMKSLIPTYLNRLFKQDFDKAAGFIFKLNLKEDLYQFFPKLNKNLKKKKDKEFKPLPKNGIEDKGLRLKGDIVYKKLASDPQDISSLTLDFPRDHPFYITDPRTGKIQLYSIQRFFSLKEAAVKAEQFTSNIKKEYWNSEKLQNKKEFYSKYNNALSYLVKNDQDGVENIAKILFDPEILTEIKSKKYSTAINSQKDTSIKRNLSVTKINDSTNPNNIFKPSDPDWEFKHYEYTPRYSNFSKIMYLSIGKSKLEISDKFFDTMLSLEALIEHYETVSAACLSKITSLRENDYFLTTNSNPNYTQIFNFKNEEEKSAFIRNKEDTNEKLEKILKYKSAKAAKKMEIIKDLKEEILSILAATQSHKIKHVCNYHMFLPPEDEMNPKKK